MSSRLASRAAASSWSRSSSCSRRSMVCCSRQTMRWLSIRLAPRATLARRWTTQPAAHTRPGGRAATRTTGPARLHPASTRLSTVHDPGPAAGRIPKARTALTPPQPSPAATTGRPTPRAAQSSFVGHRAIAGGTVGRPAWLGSHRPDSVECRPAREGMGKHRKPAPKGGGSGNGGRILLTIEGMRVATVPSVVLVASVLIAGILTLVVAGLGDPADHPAGSASPEPGQVAVATTGSPTQLSDSGSIGHARSTARTAADGRARPTNKCGGGGGLAGQPVPGTPTSPSGARPSPTSSPTTPPAPGHPTITPPGRSRPKSPHP